MTQTNKSYIFLLKKLVVLILFLVLMDVVLGRLLEHFYFIMQSGETSRITYAMTKANEHVIIFGSSRANHNYVTNILADTLRTSVYNAGIDGQSILFHYGLFKSIRSRAGQKIILLDLNINEFEKDELAYNRLAALLPYYNSHREIQPVVNLRSRYEPIKAMSSLYRYNSFVMPVILNNIITRKDNSRNGYVPLYRTMDTGTLVALPARKMSILDSTRVNIFRTFLKEAQSSGCRVFVFISPIFQKQISLTSTLTLAEHICKEEHVSFINHSALFLENFPSFFQDRWHLNDSGAVYYTRMICSEIKKTTL